ncbi:MAG: tRNA (adenosine(37)-N6)-threonylcarbamoyltransferase complex ATPase subunit type 1 TsaE [Candidatus Omnitrophica bacterium]|jgi:tRNA threonylcarbamoyladenosine biosynthesis protein TsaE|nr:tRNA (adenosine(37)-N6)-threonylcarbamoyltransferase complex ATPase subunit type 1 TsaE [Candidatus Omnitrophota bacterium]MDD5661384.1 tRNA (adenosine(37)-N6)-threonylcarbamoyltransferase complex ATPase subunit type 1 TsaE [Candidatus Omnitrophota bacterium]
MQKLSRSVNQSLAIGKILAQNLCGGEIILLSGPLGAGKTVFAKGIAQGLGISKNNIISPTFVLLRIHKGRHILQHFDLYRIKDAREIFALGYEEYFYSCPNAVTIIEWPERLKFLLPREFLKVKLSFKGTNKRLLGITARGAKYKKILEKINEDIGD